MLIARAIKTQVFPSFQPCAKTVKPLPKHLSVQAEREGKLPRAAEQTGGCSQDKSLLKVLFITFRNLYFFKLTFCLYPDVLFIIQQAVHH